MPEFRAVKKVEEVPENGGTIAFVDGRQLALFRLDGEVFALDGECPHKQGPLGMGFCERGHVFCPLHGWEFDIRTGLCVDHPGRDAAKIPARIVGDMVEIAL